MREDLIKKELKIINLGLKSFTESFKKQNIPALHIDWKPPQVSDKTLKILDALKR